MNVPYPGSGHRSGLAASVSIMITTAVTHRPLGARLELAASVEDGDRERCRAAALNQLRDIMPVDSICDGLGHRRCQAETG